MATSFPTTPAVNDIVTVGDTVYRCTIAKSGSVPAVWKPVVGAFNGVGAAAFGVFNGATAALETGAFNVSSVTRNAAGDYTITLTTPLPDMNYTVLTSNMRGINATASSGYETQVQRISSSQFRIATVDSAGVQADYNTVYFAILSSSYAPTPNVASNSNFNTPVSTTLSSSQTSLAYPISANARNIRISGTIWTNVDARLGVQFSFDNAVTWKTDAGYLYASQGYMDSIGGTGALGNLTLAYLGDTGPSAVAAQPTQFQGNLNPGRTGGYASVQSNAGGRSGVNGGFYYSNSIYSTYVTTSGRATNFRIISTTGTPTFITGSTITVTEE